MKELDETLFETGNIMRRGVRLVIENIGRAIAIITVIVTALVLFCDIGFADFSTERFTSTLIIMLIASYVMYFSCYDTGEEAGRGTEEYKLRDERYNKLTVRIEGRHLSSLRSYLTIYSEQEAIYRRTFFLLQSGYTYDEYEAYKKGVKCGRKARRVFAKASGIKPTPIQTSALLWGTRKNNKSEIRDPEAGKLGGAVLKLIPMTLCSVFTVSIILTAKDGLSAIGVIEGILKISSLLIIGLRGYLAGMTYSRTTLPAWIDTKCRLLDDFLRSYGEESDVGKEN